MKIAILTSGTRGDIQPYVVLGQALQQRGHQVRLAAAKNFESLALSYGIDFVPVDADFQAVLDSEEGKKMMKGNPFAIWRNLNTWIYPMISNSLDAFYQLALESDLVLYHVKTLADSFADQFPEKMIRASVLPIVEPTREFANPALSGLPIPAFLNRLSYTLSNYSIRLLSKPIGSFRKKYGLPKNFSVPKVKNIYGLSPSFLPLPKDYQSSSHFHGFWFGQSSEQLSEDLSDFLQSGEAPLLITFGSMPFKVSFDWQNVLLQMSEQFHIRIILVKGWGLQQTERLENHPNLKVISAAPYEKLFPLVRAVIHHGGIGTTAECLRAGKPFMVCPILYPMGDQQFWGNRAHQKGLGPMPIPLKKMTAAKWMQAVQLLLSREEWYVHAQELKMRIAKEEGIGRTVADIEGR
jgi:sterol 3beta-glucosyltransferase